MAAETVYAVADYQCILLFTNLKCYSVSLRYHEQTLQHVHDTCVQCSTMDEDFIINPA